LNHSKTININRYFGGGGEATGEMLPVVLAEANRERLVMIEATLSEKSESQRIVTLKQPVVLVAGHPKPFLINLRPFILYTLSERIKVREKRIALRFEQFVCTIFSPTAVLFVAIQACDDLTDYCVNSGALDYSCRTKDMEP